MTQFDPSGDGGPFDPNAPFGQPPAYPAGPDAPYGVPYANMATPASRRPTSVLVLAIFGIIVGGLGLLCTPFAPLAYSIQIGPPNPVIQMTRNDPVLWNWTLAACVVGTLLAVLLLAGSVGILGLRRWARSTLLLWAVLAALMGVASAVVEFGFKIPKLMALQNGSNDPALRSAVPSGIAAAVVAVPIAFALPVCVLYFLTRPKVKAAFDSPTA